MDRAKLVRLEEAEVVELKALVEAEVERRLSGIKERIMAEYFISAQYDKPEVWERVKAEIVELVESPLVGMRQALGLPEEAPPEEAEPEPAPEEPAPEPAPEEPAEKPEARKSRA